MNRLIGTFALLAMAFLFLAVSTDAGDKKDDKKNEKKKEKKKGPDFPAAKHGPEHKVLQGLVGNYDAKVKFFMDPTKPPLESTGTMNRKMILNGNFLQETFKGKFMDKAFAGMGVIGYDSYKKKYVTTWYDSATTSTSIMYGNYDADSKTFTATGEEVDKDGKKMKARDVLKIVSGEEQYFEMFRQPEGSDKEFKVMEITYLKKKVEEKKKKTEKSTKKLDNQ